MDDNSSAVVQQAPAQLKDYQRAFSARSIKNYLACLFAAFGYQGLSYALFSSYLTYVYSEFLGVAPALIASVMSVGIIVDGVSDLIMGVVVDRVRTKWGKAKHWFIIFALPLGASILLMFMVPEKASSVIKGVYAFLMYNLFCTFCTTIRIPAGALGSLVTDNSRVRGYIGWAAGAATTVGTSVVGWLLTPLTQVYGETLYTYRLVTIICGIATAVLCLLAGILLEEQRTKADWEELDRVYMKQQNREKKETVIEQFKHVFTNNYWVRYLVINLFGSISMGFNFGCLAYFLQFVVGDMSWIGIVMTVLSIPNFVGCFLGIPVASFMEARRAVIISMALQAVCCVGMWIAGAAHMPILLTCLGAKALLSGATAPASQVLVTRIVDYGEWKNGVRQEGLTGAGVGVLMKIASALATAILGFVLASAGYTGSGNITPQAIEAIRFCFLGVPCITAVITAGLWFSFKLDEKSWLNMRADIDARRAAFDASEQAELDGGADE